MTAQTENFTIEAGTDYLRTINVFEADGTTVKNLTGYTARMYLKRSYKSLTTVQLTTENARLLISNPTDGKIVISLPNSVTATLSGDYVYDMEIVSNLGFVTRVIQGTITISPEVTK